MPKEDLEYDQIRVIEQMPEIEYNVKIRKMVVDIISKTIVYFVH